jgi:hypothetical protein
MKNILLQVAMVLLFVISVNSQVKEKPLLKKLSVKGNIEFSNFSNTSFSGMSKGYKSWLLNYGGSISYEHSQKLSLEVEYKYVPQQFYSDRITNTVTQFGETDIYHLSSGMSSHVFNLKANYFLSKDRGVNPIYFIGGVSFVSQPVENTQSYRNAYPQGWSYYREILVESRYMRYLIGPMAGVGIYFDAGFISFATEFSFTGRVALGRDKNLTETAFNINFSPILRF